MGGLIQGVIGGVTVLLMVTAVACDGAESKTTKDTAKLHKIRNLHLEIQVSSLTSALG